VLGVSVPGSDITDEVMSAQKDESVQGAALVAVSAIGSVLLKPAVASRIVALVSENAIPVVGVLAAGYTAYKFINGASDYFSEHQDDCDNK
jgi:hypothetical protein